MGGHLCKTWAKRTLMALVIYKQWFVAGGTYCFWAARLTTLTSWFYFSWRCLTPISHNLRLGGGGVWLCRNRSGKNYSMSKIRLFHYWILLKEGSLGFQSLSSGPWWQDAYNNIMPKWTGADLVEGFHVVSAVCKWRRQKCEVSRERWSPDMSEMKAKWDISYI